MKRANIHGVEIGELVLDELVLPIIDSAGKELVSGWVSIPQGQLIDLVDGEEVTRLIKHEQEGEMLLTLTYKEEEEGGAAFLNGTISAAESGKEYKVLNYTGEIIDG